MLEYKEWVASKFRTDDLDNTFSCPGLCGTEESQAGWVYGGEFNWSFIIEYKDQGNTRYCVLAENHEFDGSELEDAEQWLYDNWARDDMWYALSGEEQENYRAAEETT